MADLRRAAEEEAHSAALKAYSQRQLQASKVQQGLILKLAAKVNERIDNLKPDEIDVRHVAPLLRAIAAMSDSSGTAEAAALGVDELLRSIE